MYTLGDINEVLRKAAFGDGAALSWLAVACLHMDGVSLETNVFLSELLSRMAAFHGRNDDAFRVAQLLTAQAAKRHDEGDEERAIDNIAEAMVIYDRLGEAGDPDAPRALDLLIGAASTEGLCQQALDRAKLVEAELHGG